MRNLIAGALLLFVGLGCLFQYSRADDMPLLGVGTKGAGFTASCSQSANFIARETTPTNNVIIDAFICGGVSDGWWAKMDVVQIYQADNTTNALLNAVGNFSNGIANGAPTFSAGVGYLAASNNAQFIDTNFNPTTATCGGSCNFTQNSKHISVCVPSITTIVGGILIGEFDGTNFIQILNNGSAVNFYDDNGTAPASDNASIGAAFFMGTRTSSSAIRLDINGTQVATATPTSVALPNQTLYVMNRNGSGGSFGTATFALATLGGALTGTDSTNLRNRVHTLTGGC